jgi:hypothetical protein
MRVHLDPRLLRIRPGAVEEDPRLAEGVGEEEHEAPGPAHAVQPPGDLADHAVGDGRILGVPARPEDAPLLHLREQPHPRARPAQEPEARRHPHARGVDRVHDEVGQVAPDRRRRRVVTHLDRPAAVDEPRPEVQVPVRDHLLAGDGLLAGPDRLALLGLLGDGGRGQEEREHDRREPHARHRRTSRALWRIISS